MTHNHSLIKESNTTTSTLPLKRRKLTIWHMMHPNCVIDVQHQGEIRPNYVFISAKSWNYMYMTVKSLNYNQERSRSQKTINFYMTQKQTNLHERRLKPMYKVLWSAQGDFTLSINKPEPYMDLKFGYDGKLLSKSLISATPYALTRVY